MHRRMEDRIRSLCEQLTAEKDAKKLQPMLVELRDTLHQHIARMRDRLAEYPLSVERRNRDS